METVRAVRWGTCANPRPRRVRVSSSQRIGPRNGFIPKGILRECGDCPMEFVFTGYHATSRDRAEAIMRRNFKKSKSGWLGEGVYFFEDNPKLAVEWARYKYRNDENALSAVTVIQSEIRCHKEKILDLTNPQSEDVSDFHRVRQNIIIHLRKFGKKTLILRKQVGLVLTEWPLICCVQKEIFQWFAIIHLRLRCWIVHLLRTHEFPMA